jgi:ribosomal-protein-alanine N-acetyltransferase
VSSDARALLDLLTTADASRFGIDEEIDGLAVGQFLEKAWRDRAAGVAFTYVVELNATRRVVGLVQVRALDPAWEASEWEGTLALTARGTPVFLEAARLAGSFAFDVVGTHRLEARVPLRNGRANGALRKLGAVQEGVLRRSLRCGGEYLDQVLWSVLKEDWLARRETTDSRVH